MVLTDCIWCSPGPGIDPVFLPHVFDRFYRAGKNHSHHQRNSEGTGLGLSTTMAIIESHGGVVSAQSDENETVFTISIPR
jgi:signal transduction histidine kinase